MAYHAFFLSDGVDCLDIFELFHLKLLQFTEVEGVHVDETVELIV